MKKGLTRFARISMTLALVLVFVFSAPVATSARDSESTRKGTALYPLYWTAYEPCFTTDQPLSETRWQDNIDWVASTLLPYGYNMVTTDGWLGGSTVTNANGYLVKYNDNWQHDWQYWVDYAASLGLDTGVYYNPLWVVDSVVGDASKTIVGTNLRVDSIYNSGWVDYTQPGAQEYVQGYVNYFKDMGVRFLRIDFLCWYETGSVEYGAPGFGTQGYATALSWIEEAAGDDMEISLVMPNSFNHAENELAYGDLMRVDTDTTNGDWTWLNYGSFGDERQTWNSGFCQWANPFQGLTGFSDVGGRGNLTLDGDFMRIHNFTGAYAEDEKKTAISLFTMAGSPIAVADQYDTLGGNLSYYTNPEILSLKKEGFVGKPIYYNGNPFEPAQSGDPDTGSRDSERWIGQASNGDWVVALFNRSDSWAAKSIDFSAVLGLPNGGYVHNIWTHEDMGYMTSYNVNLSPHDTVMFRIVPAPTSGVRYEAEVASFRSGAHFNNDHTGRSGEGFVDQLSGDHVGANVLFGVYADYAGSHQVSLRYANATGSASSATVSVRDIDNDAVSNATFSLPDLSTWNDWGTVTQAMTLQQGLNLIEVKRGAGDQGAFNLDYIEIGGANLANPGFESGSISGWTATGANYGVDASDAYSGSYKCYFWSTSAFTQKIDQTVSLPDGTYLVTAMVKQDTGTPALCRMELSGYGGSAVYANVPHGSTYAPVSGMVTVTNGQLNVAFYEDAPGSTNLQIDDVSIMPCGNVQNFGFESGDLSGWTATGANYGVDASDAYQGDYKCYFWNASAFTQKIEQAVAVPNGTHTVTAWVKQDSGTPTLCRMELSDYDGDQTSYSYVPHGSEYVQISEMVYVTTGEITVAFYEEGDNVNLQIDNVVIY